MAVSLLHFDQVPPYQKINPYIRKGYRSRLTHDLCIQSLFWWTNETVNIWSHVSGFGMISLMMLYDVMFGLNMMEVNTNDFVIILCTALSFQFCLMCSAAYHTFCCQSEEAYCKWLFLDILGICISLTFIFVSGIHFAFHCFPIYRSLYIASVLTLFALLMMTMIHPNYKTDDYFHWRLFLFISWALYGIIPVVHWIYLKGGINVFIIRVILPRIIVMYLISGLAFIIYITKYPEKLWPGKVDYIGSSHQWWHILIVCAFYWWYNTGLTYLKLRKFDQCY
ncbi:hypothetical protein CHUAL_000212 [Chamberlinius hualienensis]